MQLPIRTKVNNETLAMASIKIGLKGSYQLLVKKEHSAARVGSGLLDVFSTPSMVAMMEKTAADSLQALLSEGQSSVGAEINVRHLRPTQIGDRVRVESEVTQVEGRKVSFVIRAWDSQAAIGEATHVRYLVDNKRFLEKMNG